MPKIIPVAVFRLRRVRRHRRPDAAKTAAGAVLPLPRRPDARRNPRIIGAARSHLSDEDFRDRAAKALEKHVAAGRSGPGDDAPLPGAAALRLDRRDRAGCRLEPLRRAARRRPRAGVLPRHLARPVWPDLPGAGRQRAGHRTVPRGAGKADRPRPGSAHAIIERRRQGVHRGADLPHRPLPGQGDGAEPDGAALRQHDLRAAVDRRRDRPRADHRGRNRRAGRPRRLLRQIRRAARHGAEPHAAVAVPDRDGAAGVAGCRPGARREAEGAARAEADGAARGRGA